jgi:hypothetical protein
MSNPPINPLTIEFVENTLLPEYADKGLVKVLKKYHVDVSTFFKFLVKHPQLAECFDAMQLARSEVYADEIVTIADEDPNPLRARNRIEARKWAASKFKPAKFGDRIDVNITETIDIRGALADARARSLTVVNSTAIAAPNNTNQIAPAPEQDSASIVPVK